MRRPLCVTGTVVAIAIGGLGRASRCIRGPLNIQTGLALHPESVDDCKGVTVPFAVGRWYKLHEFGCHLRNVRSRYLVNILGGENA